FMLPTKGKLLFSSQQKTINNESIYKHISFASPYLQLEDDLSLEQNIWFYKQFKDLQIESSADFCKKAMFDKMELAKPIGKFSSGMKQRLKLAFALFTRSDVKLFDEPHSNLDAKGIDWFSENFHSFCNNSTVILSSNHQQKELSLCSEVLDIEHYK
ncbi:MAG: ATP-binding cassette domain-containing protein, partial [Bacteroidia bacterium]|nr:ATP-binding cassette domain-containing protein [Bacteroidia bacterium]